LIEAADVYLVGSYLCWSTFVGHRFQPVDFIIKFVGYTDITSGGVILYDMNTMI